MKAAAFPLRLLVLVSAIGFAGCAAPSAISTRGERTSVFAASDLYEIPHLDHAPTPLTQRRPEYPTPLGRAGVSGKAVVDVIIDREGQVQNVRLLGASHPLFGKAAVTCVSAWTYRPGVKDGVAVNTHLQIPITFTTSDRP